MIFPGLTRFLSGVLVPVQALRGRESVGVGEFTDLGPLARWCSAVGMDLIQILPVNDTGRQSSPYSALSAFALHEDLRKAAEGLFVFVAIDDKGKPRPLPKS